MKVKVFLSFLILMGIFTSCKKDTEDKNSNLNTTVEEKHYLSFKVTCYDNNNNEYHPVALKIIVYNFDTKQELISGNTDIYGWFAIPYAINKETPLRIELKDIDNRCIEYYGITEGLTEINAPSIFVSSTDDLEKNDAQFNLGSCQTQYPELSGCW